MSRANDPHDMEYARKFYGDRVAATWSVGTQPLVIIFQNGEMVTIDRYGVTCDEGGPVA